MIEIKKNIHKYENSNIHLHKHLIFINKILTDII